MAGQQPKPSRAALSARQKWGWSAAVTLIAIVLLLALAEGAIRARQYFKYGAAESLEDLYKTDDALGLRVLIPGKRTARININSAGFRGPEIVQPKPKELVRIAFVGASTTYCAEVSGNDQVWPHLVTAEVSQRFPHAKFDYVNAGVPGYVIESSHKNLRLRLAALQPDVIVIYEGINDLSREMRDLAIAAGLAKDEQRESWLARQSLLWSLVEKNLRIRQAQKAAANSAAQLNFDPAQVGSRFKQDLSALVAEAKQVAPIVAIATLTLQIRADQSKETQANAAASALYYMPFMTPESILATYARYNEIIRQVAAEQAVILIGQEQSIPGDGVHFNDTVHFKDAGSRLMAKRVSEALAASAAVGKLASAR